MTGNLLVVLRQEEISFFTVIIVFGLNSMYVCNDLVTISILILSDMKPLHE